MLIAGLIVIVCATPFFAIARSVFARDRKIATWPRAEALVTMSSLETDVRRNTDAGAAWNSYYTWYRPVIRYTYNVGGKQFEGRAISRADEGAWMDDVMAKRIVARYPVDAKTAALYDPADPGKSYLEVRRSTGAVILFCLGLLVATIGALLTFLALL